MIYSSMTENNYIATILAPNSGGDKRTMRIGLRVERIETDLRLRIMY